MRRGADPAATRVAIGLGANTGDAPATLRRATRRLAALGRIVARSPLYRSRPWGSEAQPDFVNAVVLLETGLPPLALLRALKGIERALGRVPTYRWGPRAIDLDILTFGDRRIARPELTVPHARLFERAFALAPLADVDPHYARFLAALSPSERAGVQRIPPEAARTPPSVDWDQTLERVRAAAEFCAAAELSRFRIDEADIEIEIRRTSRATRPTAPVEAAPPSRPNGAAPSSNGVGAHDEPAATLLKAEFVGIVRLSRPAVAEGTVLPGDRELAFVESLGIRNPVRAGGPGRVAKIFVTDGQSVEYGQALFAIEANPA